MTHDELLPRRRPRWSELRPLLQLSLPKLSRQAAVQRAASIDDLRALARRYTPRAAFDYVDGAAESEQSYARSRAAFDRVEFRPQILRDVAAPNSCCTWGGGGCKRALQASLTGRA